MRFFYHVAHVNGRISAITLGYDLGLGTSTQVSALVYQSVKSIWDLLKKYWCVNIPLDYHQNGAN